MFDTLRDNSRIVVYVVVVIFVVSGGFMGFGAYLNNQSGGQPAGNQTPSVIAEVNGMEISQQEYFSLLQQQAPQSNLSSSQIIPFRYNVLDALMERKLILSQAEILDINVEVSESEIDENYNNILEQNDMTDQELADNLAEQGYTIGQLREDIKSSLADTKTIRQTIDQGVGDIEVTEEEIEELYAERYPANNDTANNDTENNDGETDQTEENPDLSEVREELETEIRNQKRNQALNTWLAELKNEAEIVINDPVLSAYHALENENYAEAVEKFSSFVEEEETDPIFYTYLAEAYAGQESYQQAEDVYNNAVENHPENINLKFNFAQFLADQEKNDEALSQLDQISENAEDDLMTYYQLFMMYNQLGAEEKAQSAMEEVQRLSEQMQTETAPDINEDSAEDIEEEVEEDIEVEDNLNIDENNN